jgi:hypothetical protein
VVLDGAHQDSTAALVGAVSCPVQALDREVVRLRAARGEDDLAGAGADRGRELLAMWRARRPEVCSEEALPARASSSVMAVIASGSMGVVAAWSR